MFWNLEEQIDRPGQIKTQYWHTQIYALDPHYMQLARIRCVQSQGDLQASLEL